MIRPMERISPRAVRFECDRSVYSGDIVAKTLYWLMDEYRIYQQMTAPDILSVTLERKCDVLDDGEFQTLQDRLNQDLNDYILRRTILEETREIRAILYVKAFAPYDAAYFSESEA